MDVLDVLIELANNGVKLQVSGDNLKVHAKHGLITSEIQVFIRENKVEILQLIKNRSLYRSIPVAPEKGHYALSPAQRRMYFLYRFDSSSLSYNMP
ncbi:hypothetical protein, partial [Maribacter sp. 2307UL18-2]|uniref:TubC N-terminal docking domain-related protein n=1 Tax=Maribacter sp. 2307UL18-2 TaxID=3386274 RepID=UPI0039BCB32E